MASIYLWISNLLRNKELLLNWLIFYVINVYKIIGFFLFIIIFKKIYFGGIVNSIFILENLFGFYEGIWKLVGLWINI